MICVWLCQVHDASDFLIQYFDQLFLLLLYVLFIYNILQVVPLYWAFYILGGSLITEGGTLLMAAHAIRKGAQQQQMSFTEYGKSVLIDLKLFRVHSVFFSEVTSYSGLT